MTISTYQVDNVIKAYNKQQKARLRFESGCELARDKHEDVVTLSATNDRGEEIYSKISYNLLDVLTKQKR